MPVFYSYDEKSNVVRTFAMSECGSSDLIENMKNIVNSSDIQDGFVELVDLERANGLALSPCELDEFHDMLLECNNKGCKKVIFYHPNHCLKEAMGLLKGLLGRATFGDREFLAFANSHEQLQELMTA